MNKTNKHTLEPCKVCGCPDFVDKGHDTYMCVGCGTRKTVRR